MGQPLSPSAPRVTRAEWPLLRLQSDIAAQEDVHEALYTGVKVMAAHTSQVTGWVAMLNASCHGCPGSTWLPSPPSWSALWQVRVAQLTTCTFLMCIECSLQACSPGWVVACSNGACAASLGWEGGMMGAVLAGSGRADAAGEGPVPAGGWGARHWKVVSCAGCHPGPEGHRRALHLCCHCAHVCPWPLIGWAGISKLGPACGRSVCCFASCLSHGLCDMDSDCTVQA